MTKISKTSDESIVDADGRLLFMSSERFKRDICEGTSCFLCGAGRNQAQFNDEHILPAWILRQFNLYNDTLTLPNGTRHRYGTYTIPCCEGCNSLLGRELETPLSKVFLGGHSAVAEYSNNSGTANLFTWMALIFLKAHLKDATLRFNVNLSLPDDTIAQTYEYQWGMFHHLHCLVRAIYVGATVLPEAIGSLWILPAAVYEGHRPFDYIDLSYAQTFAIRLNDVAIIAVFDDSCAVLNGLWDLIPKIKGPLNGAQIRELTARMACCNLHLRNKPAFKTWVEEDDVPRVYIAGYHDQRPRFREYQKEVFGQLMLQVLGDFMPRVEGHTEEEAKQLLSDGKFSFLFDNEGSFIQDGFRPRG